MLDIAQNKDFDDQVCEDVDLKHMNSFGINAKARYFFNLTDRRQLACISLFIADKKCKYIILGEGTNVILPEYYNGLVIHNQLKSIKILDSITHHDACLHDAKNMACYTQVVAASGEQLDDLIMFCLEHNIFGLENLSGVPGTVGAAPIQNVGAYGVEVGTLIRSVEVYNLRTQTIYNYTQDECQFSYRGSIFKNNILFSDLNYDQEQKNVSCQPEVILSVTFNLSKKFIPNIQYNDIKRFFNESNRGVGSNKQASYETQSEKTKLINTASHETQSDAIELDKITAQDLRVAIIAIRQSKLPPYSEIGNVGSFFLNPTIMFSKLALLKAQYPNIVYYANQNTQNIRSTAVDDFVKISAAWLLDNIGFKGYVYGNIGMYDQHALVMINLGNAKQDEVIALSKMIQEKCFDQYGIMLHIEPRIIPSNLS